ncbi:MAG: hypothetical protein M3Q64_02015, partial [bacterium]|nr:hypothetical protein [bacterium]
MPQRKLGLLLWNDYGGIERVEASNDTSAEVAAASDRKSAGSRFSQPRTTKPICRAARRNSLGRSNIKLSIREFFCYKNTEPVMIRHAQMLFYPLRLNICKSFFRRASP